jgi:hypothetical protein
MEVEGRKDVVQYNVYMHIFTLLSDTFISQLEENRLHFLNDMLSFYLGRATHNAYFDKHLDIC